MGLEVQITSDRAGKQADVSNQGELITRAFAYSDPQFKNMDLVDTAYNFFVARTSFRFVITGIILDANRNVGANGASVIIYEATTATTITVSKTLFEFDMVKQSSKVLVPLLVQTTEGVFVSGKTDDDDVLATVMGYYISA